MRLAYERVHSGLLPGRVGRVAHPALALPATTLRVPHPYSLSADGWETTTIQAARTKGANGLVSVVYTDHGSRIRRIDARLATATERKHEEVS